MRRPIALRLFALSVLAGCGSTDSSTPVACLEGRRDLPEGTEGRAWRSDSSTARRRSPTAWPRTRGGRPGHGRRRRWWRWRRSSTPKRGPSPGGAANLRLGYLLGAAQRGADRTDGIHAELIRRLTAAARYSPDNRPSAARLPATPIARASTPAAKREAEYAPASNDFDGGTDLELSSSGVARPPRQSTTSPFPVSGFRCRWSAGWAG